MLTGLVVVAVLCTDICRENSLTIVDADRVITEQSETIRIYNIEVPHIASSCPSETQQSQIAMAALATMLMGKEVRVVAIGRDFEGATLAAVSIHGRDLGEAMLARDLATRRGQDINWCSR